MANNSINARFRNLYDDVKDNLSEISKDILKSLYKSGAKSLHQFRNNLLELLNNEYSKIINALAVEYNISVKELKYWLNSDKWFYYGIAIERLNEQIHKYLSEEELDDYFEEILEPTLNQSEEELNYWNNLRNSIYGITDEINEELDDNEYPIEESHKAPIIDKIENILPEKLIPPILGVEKDLNITGQVIDFMLQIYDL